MTKGLLNSTKCKTGLGRLNNDVAKDLFVLEKCGNFIRNMRRRFEKTNFIQ